MAYVVSLPLFFLLSVMSISYFKLKYSLTKEDVTKIIIERFIMPQVYLKLLELGGFNNFDNLSTNMTHVRIYRFLSAFIIYLAVVGTYPIIIFSNSFSTEQRVIAVIHLLFHLFTQYISLSVGSKFGEYARF
jgi:hypothetical protein